MTVETYAEELVNDAIALLDVKEPGWFNKIDTDRLDIASPTNCVLGQLYGEYALGLEKLYSYPHQQHAHFSAFALVGTTPVWIREINKRRPANFKPVKEPKYHWFAGLRHAVASLF